MVGGGSRLLGTAMSRLPITVATWDYDRVRALVDGRVAIEGCDVNYVTMQVEEILERAFFHREFEVAEIGLSPYLIALSRGDRPLRGGAGIPVADVSALRRLYPRRPRHRESGRLARQAHRRPGISDVGGPVGARLSDGRVRDHRDGHQLGARRSRDARPPRQVSTQSAGGLSARIGAGGPHPLVDAGGRRPRRDHLGATAVLLRRRPPHGAAAVSRLPCGRARLLSAVGRVPDHARCRDPAGCSREAPMACRQRLQGVRAGEAARRCGIRRDDGAQDRSAVGDGGVSMRPGRSWARTSGPTAWRRTARRSS